MLRWIRWLLLVAGLAAAMHACRRDARDGARAASTERAHSVQLHLHGSFSEGKGSIDSHSYEAQDVGCDVLWWSDHDFRILTYEHVTRYGFESWQEPLDRGEAWKARLAKYLGDTKGLTPSPKPRASFDFTAFPVREGQRSLRARWSAPGPDFESVSLPFVSARLLERRSLATGVTVRLAVFPEELGPDARAFVTVELSEHAPREGLPLTQYSLRYVLSNDETVPRREGRTSWMFVPFVPGEWNELVLPISADATRAFPLFPGEDDLFYGALFGLEARAGANARACFDDLRIDQELSGEPVFARQQSLLREVGALYPLVQQLQGVEISYGSRHLNLFCLETPLPDYAEIARGTAPDPEHPECIDDVAFRDAVIDQVVTRTHALGGLVSLNHLFGINLEGSRRARTNEEQLEILLRTRASGADILEVGYRDRAGASLEDHLWVWDHAALAGLRLIGTGVSDSHGGSEERWRGRPNNFVSWIFAPSPSKADLLEGLRAGRVFFGDIEAFDGEFDLATDGGARMGSSVLTDRDEIALEIRVKGLLRKAQLALIESGERAAAVPAPAGEFVQEHALRLPDAGSAFVRAELRDEGGQAFALSNPIHFLRELPEGGLPAPPAAIDRDGLRSRRIEGLRITGWERQRSGGADRIRIGLEAQEGLLELDVEGFGAPEAVSLEGIEGRIAREGKRVRVEGLRGAGALILER